MRSNNLVLVAALLGSISAAHASEVTPPSNSESVTFTAVDSIDELGDPANVITTATFVGGFLANTVVVSGTLTEVATDTFASEADINIVTPGGTVAANGSTTVGYVGTLDVGPTPTAIAVPFDPAGLASFEFYESFSDAVGVDQTWDTVTITLLGGGGVVVDGSYDLGTLPTDGTAVSQDGTQVAGGLDFYTIVVGDVGNTGTYLDILTSSTGVNAHDTELALYDAAGNFVAADDDGGFGLFSNLTFGASDPFAIDPTSGEDGFALPAGTYTIVVGAFNTDFTPLIGDIVPGTAAGDYNLTVIHSGACTDVDVDGICDPVLTVSSLTVGAPATLTLTGARPGSNATFLVSLAPVSPAAVCRPAYDVCLDLGAPRSVIGTSMVDDFGVASITVTPPPPAAGATTNFQAAWLDNGSFEAEASNVVTETVAP